MKYYLATAVTSVAKQTSATKGSKTVVRIFMTVTRPFGKMQENSARRRSSTVMQSHLLNERYSSMLENWGGVCAPVGVNENKTRVCFHKEGSC